MPIYEVGQHGDQHFFSMGYVEGQNLADVVAGDGPLPPREAAELVYQIVEAVAFAHERGVIHRDLKPANVLLDKNGQPKVTDFGLAKQTGEGSDLTGTGQILGTPSYMPPEQAAGEVSRIGPQSDVYSLGAILYYLLTGRPPFQSDSVIKTLKQVLEQEPASPRQLNNEVDADLETICLKCLEKSPSRRYESASALMEELDRYLRGEPIRARRIGQLARLWRWCRRKPLAAGLIATSTAAVLFLAVGLSYRRSFEDAKKIAAQSQKLVESSQKLVESAERVAEAEKRAAAAEKYVSLIQQVREKSVTKKWGWTWESVDLLKQAAAIETPLSNSLELRSLAATVLSAFDFQESGTVAVGISPAAIAFSPNGKRLAVVQLKHGLSPTVYVYNVDSKKLEARYSFWNIAKGFEKLFRQGTGKYHDGYRSLAFSSDGRWLAGGTRFGRIVCWDTQAKKPVAKVCEAFQDDNEVKQLMFSPDDTALLACCPESYSVRRWQFQETLTATDPKIEATAISVLPYHHALAAIVSESLRMYDLKTLQPLAPESPDADDQESTDRFFKPLVASRDGRSLVCGAVRAIRVLNPLTGIDYFELQQPELDPEYFSRISFNAENDILAISGRGSSQTIAFISKRTGQWLGDLSGPGVDEAVFSPSGNHLAVRVDKQVKLYRYRSRECTTTIAHHDSLIADMQWNQHGNELTCLTVENGFDAQNGDFRWQQITRWNVDNGELLDERTLTTYSADPGVTQMQLVQSSDGRRVVSTLCGPGLWITGGGNSGLPGKPVLTPNNNQYFEIQEDDLLVEPATAAITIVEDALASNKRALRIPRSVKEWKISLDPARLKLPKGDGEWAVYALIKTESPRNAGVNFTAGAVHGKRRSEQQVPAMFFSIRDYGVCWVEAFQLGRLKQGSSRIYERSA